MSRTRRALTVVSLTRVHGAAESDHHHTAPRELPVEAGPAAFAAPAEIVALLEADPKTVSSRGDIARRHAHLGGSY